MISNNSQSRWSRRDTSYHWLLTQRSNGNHHAHVQLI